MIRTTFDFVEIIKKRKTLLVAFVWRTELDKRPPNRASLNGFHTSHMKITIDVAVRGLSDAEYK